MPGRSAGHRPGSQQHACVTPVVIPLSLNEPVGHALVFESKRIEFR